MFALDDNRKIGIGLTFGSVLFTLMGVALFFDRALLTLANLMYRKRLIMLTLSPHFIFIFMMLLLLLSNCHVSVLGSSRGWLSSLVPCALSRSSWWSIGKPALFLSSRRSCSISIIFYLVPSQWKFEWLKRFTFCTESRAQCASSSVFSLCLLVGQWLECWWKGLALWTCLVTFSLSSLPL